MVFFHDTTPDMRYLKVVKIHIYIGSFVRNIHKKVSTFGHNLIGDRKGGEGGIGAYLPKAAVGISAAGYIVELIVE